LIGLKPKLKHLSNEFSYYEAYSCLMVLAKVFQKTLKMIVGTQLASYYIVSCK